MQRCKIDRVQLEYRSIVLRRAVRNLGVVPGARGAPQVRIKFHSNQPAPPTRAGTGTHSYWRSISSPHPTSQLNGKNFKRSSTLGRYCSIGRKFARASKSDQITSLSYLIKLLCQLASSASQFHKRLGSKYCNKRPIDRT